MTKSEGVSQNPFGDEKVYGCPWAYDAGFSIDTVEPSGAVKEALSRSLIPDGSRVLDLGCGKNPRNAIFLAHQHKCQIDAFDLEPLEFPKGLPINTYRKIHFKQGSVLEFDYGKDIYRVGIMARLIQYLSPQEMESLFLRVSESLISGGVVILSYTAEGGILNRSRDYGIVTHAHPIEKVQELLRQNNFSIGFLQQGANESTHVPHAGEKAVTYDLIAQKDGHLVENCG